ncbi:hypothetical protein JMA_41460 (plasmid) [Jeotgalibacillus malaysiensis]|uniref:Uncharacterized protein n=1 Tax=Jeotgalibacillus malaysiensis TaxID=1508404 RepID=A0A0B5AY64_9BACL|nr:hypothetical protein [Jeotgalibacillus malaysiensis]AJD93463.1 hypothetical protein JMA_41460 [Jeotgalibacillus malaysiensis]
MKNMMERAKFVCGGEEGASNVELIIWFSVVFILALALYAFGDDIQGFLSDSGDSVNGLSDQVNDGKLDVDKGRF